MRASFTPLIDTLFGTQDPLLFCSLVFWAGVGVVLSLLLYAAKRDALCQRNPTQFTWKFLIFDNARRIVTSLILILVMIRFSRQLIGLQPDAFTAFIIGLSSDNLVKIVQKKILQ